MLMRSVRDERKVGTVKATLHLVWLAAITPAVALAGEPKQAMKTAESPIAQTPSEKATFGGGCFWCLEAVFERVEGVRAVTSGYAGGRTERPTYKEVCSGRSGHAEVVQIQYDPKRVSYEQLLEIFWDAHDPTTLNRQGADEGTQYRSIILYHHDGQKQAADRSKRAAAARFADPIVTEVVALTTFFPAEDYHQDYFRKNPNAPYCAVVIRPKLEKLMKQGGRR
jgi:peptide-methionine (S)-S-oxide reductase